MSKNIVGINELLANYYSTAIPELEREYFEIARSTVNVGVWLVGLSTGVIALLMSSESTRNNLSGHTFEAGIILFSLVILFGVLQRVFFHVVEFRKWPISLRLRGALIGLTDTSRGAQELQEFWSVNNIVEKLREDFGLDYEFLIDNQATLDDARKAYNGILRIHREYEEEGLKHLSEILCAHYGLPKSEEENFFGKKKPKDIEETRQEAVVVNRISIASNTSYYVSAVCFIFGILTLTYGAI